MPLKKTIQDQLITGLVNLGFKEIKTRSSKYRAFERTKGKAIYFIGRKGVIRTGYTASKSHVPHNVDSVRKTLLEASVKGGNNA